MEDEQKSTTAKHNFILQQGLTEPEGEACSVQFEALQFMPRIVAGWLVLGVILQSPAVFLLLSALLWWSALVPEWNPFDILYNLTFGARPAAVLLGQAPAPRRFAQGMAATFALLIGISLLFHWRGAAYVFQALFLGAVAALVFGRFCLGSFIYHLVHGRFCFAMRTLPWVQDGQAAAGSSCGR